MLACQLERMPIDLSDSINGAAGMLGSAYNLAKMGGEVTLYPRSRSRFSPADCARALKFSTVVALSRGCGDDLFRPPSVSQLIV